MTCYAEQSNNPQVLLSLLEERDHEIVRLQNILHKLQKEQFGSKSEKIAFVPEAQLALPVFEQEVPAPEAQAEKKIEVPAHQRRKRRPRDISDLPRNRIPCLPESTVCRCCGKELTCIGEDISHELERQPAKLFVNEYVRPRYACSQCKDVVVQAPLPPEAKPLGRCNVGAGLLSYIIVSKYVDHLPLHRQEQIFSRQGVELPRKLMCSWVGGVVDEYLAPLWSLHQQEVFAEQYLQADETTLKVQDPEKQGVCHTGYLWGACSPLKKLVVFEYAESRAGAVAKDIFEDFTGALQTDAYAGYNPVLLPEKVMRIACLAHVRRKFIEVQKVSPKETAAVLSMIAELYHLETQWCGLSPPERKSKRDKESRERLLKLEKYLSDLAERTLPKAPLMEAIQYTLKQWDAIMRILDDGLYHLDNNCIEREMRPIAIGRKNYLFAGSHEGARWAAVIYSFFATARLHKVNPYNWLQDVLRRMRSLDSNRYCELLPQHWIKIKA